jgi:F0F1-type ATP synthase epsilon subunit
MQKNNLYLVVKSREATLFEGFVKSVSSFNEKGPFDILLTHAQFISLLNDVIIIEREDGQKQEIEVQNGICRVINNKVDVFLRVKKI